MRKNILKDVNNVYSLLTLEPVEIEFGYSLIPLADESVGGRADQQDRYISAANMPGYGVCDPIHPARDSSSLDQVSIVSA